MELKEANERIMRQLKEEINKKEAEVSALNVQHEEERQKFSQFVARLSEKVNITVQVQGPRPINEIQLAQVLHQLINGIDIGALGQECGLNMQVERPVTPQQVYQQPRNNKGKCNIL